MGIVASFKPAGRASRVISVEDMKLALAELSRLPKWRARDEGSDRWLVTLERTDTIHGEAVVTHEMAMWAADDDEAAVDIGGFDDDVIAVLGQFLADRAGAQIFEDDAGSDPIRFIPAKGAKRQPAPKRAPKPKRRKSKTQRMRIVPLDAMVEELDPLARVAWLQADDPPPSRVVTLDEATRALGKGKTLALAIDRATQHVTIDGDHEDAAISALMHRLADAAGPQCLVVADEAVAAFVPATKTARGKRS
ncbi:MAG: hypothetical protein M4D80_34105 [Myxococcota bacterium]|nr:hypothetical protein [Deltaproteobacteria bacterium]MDQ3340219.1 hypothetical protein [Myxococcota bacterium]